MTRRISITGPESTGKSQLAEKLAGHYQTVWTPEYAREYLDLHGPYYKLEDIEKIARGQLAAEEERFKLASRWLFCDTDFIVLKIWAEHAFQHCPDWILKQIENHPYDLYLLCDVDLPWEPDPLREHPHLRQFFFNLYLVELNSRNLPFGIVKGNGHERLENAINIIEKRFIPG